MSYKMFIRKILCLLAAPTLIQAQQQQAQCRCLPSSPCWSSIPWENLNASTNGKLVISVDPFASCASSPNSETCLSALDSSDDEFWLSSQPNGYLHTGLFGTWNVTTTLSAYSVLAMTPEDIQAAVSFASAYNLRLAVKNS